MSNAINPPPNPFFPSSSSLIFALGKELTLPRVVFDPRTNFRFEQGRGMGIVFGRRDMMAEWHPIRISDPRIRDMFKQMEADSGIGWNFEFSERSE